MSDEAEKPPSREMRHDLKALEAAYQGRRGNYNFKGIYAKSYGELCDIYSTLSPEEVAARLTAEGHQTTASKASRTRHQYFPMFKRFRVTGLQAEGQTARKEKRQAEQAERIANSEIVAQLKELCDTYGLTLNLTPDLGVFLRDFELNGIRCAAQRASTDVGVGGKQRYAKFRNPLDVTRKAGDFAVFFVDIHTTRVDKKTFYFVPMQDISRANYSQGIYIPAVQKSTREGLRPRLDWDKYEGEKGVALLKAAIEAKKQAEQT